MAENERDETFSFLDGPRPEAVRLRSRKPGGPVIWRRHAVGLVFPAILLVAVLNFSGVIAIPGLEGLTREKLQAEKVAKGPVAAHVPPPVVVMNPPIVRKAGAPPVRIRNVAQANLRPEPSENRALTARGSVGEATAAGSEPGALLAGKGIVLGESGMALRSEADAKAKVLALRSRVRDFNASFDRTIALRSAANRIEEIERILILGNSRIATLDFAMKQYAPYWVGGRWIHGMNMLENGEYEQFRAERDGLIRDRDAHLIPERDLLSRERPGRGQEEASHDLSLRREAALAAMTEARQAVDATIQGYAALAGDDAVRRALARTGHVRFEPSEGFRAAVRELEQAEKTASRLRLTTGQ